MEAYFAQPAEAEDLEPAIAALARQGVQALITIPQSVLLQASRVIE